MNNVQKTVWITFCISQCVVDIIAWKLQIFISNLCSSMKLEKQLIKIRAFNGHPPITVIARSLSVIFLPKHRSLTIDMLLDKHNNLQAFLMIILF